MAERPLTISGLLDKRAELIGQIKATRRKLYNLTADLDHLDHTIRMFDPEGEVRLKKPRRESTKVPAFKGELQRYILNALREAERPLTSIELAIHVVNQSGMDPNERETVQVVRKRVGAALTKMRARKLIQEVPQLGSYKGWQIQRESLSS